MKFIILSQTVLFKNKYVTIFVRLSKVVLLYKTVLNWLMLVIFKLIDIIILSSIINDLLWAIVTI